MLVSEGSHVVIGIYLTAERLMVNYVRFLECSVSIFEFPSLFSAVDVEYCLQCISVELSECESCNCWKTQSESQWRIPGGAVGAMAPRRLVRQDRFFSPIFSKIYR